MSPLNPNGDCHAEGLKPGPAGTTFDLAEIRARLTGLRGRNYWRGLEELAGTDGFREFLHREFPRQASEFTDLVSRRDFLHLMAASLALAGLSGCTRNPVERIVPYVKSPERIVPGEALYYATALNHGGSAVGVLVETQMGRPIKIEGNDLHPASLGKTDSVTQASILSLYDPDRSGTILNLGEVRPWGSFVTAMKGALTGQAANGGRGLRILTGEVLSPTVADQIEGILARYPGARWYQYDAVNHDNAHLSARLALGGIAVPHLRLADADVIVSLDGDFLGEGPESVRHIHEFASRRRAQSAPGHASEPHRNRLYAIESTLTNTGARADHRLAVPARDVPALAHGLLQAVRGASAGTAPGPRGEWIAAVARDLRAHAGRSVVVAGRSQAPAVHAAARELNQALGNVGVTVVYTEPAALRPSIHREDLAALAGEMEAGQVELLLVAGTNPVHSAPVELDFARRLDKVGLRVHLGPYLDETSDHCHWHVPETHVFEAWSDVRSADGTVTLQQPMIAPLYNGKSIHEFLAVFGGGEDRSGYDIVRDYWRRRRGGADFESFWRQSLHDGVVAGTALPHLDIAGASGGGILQGDPPPGGLEVVVRPDPHLLDGRYAGNAWLQELPRPITKLTWDNAVWVAPALAESEGLMNGDVVELAFHDVTVSGPVWIVPGLPAESVTIHTGYGRTQAGRVGSGVGFNAFPFVNARGEWSASGATLRKTGRRHELACTQGHHSMEGRNLVRSESAEENERNPGWVHDHAHDPPESLTMYPGYRYDGYKWGMTIDLSACTGCNACMVACQAENNIPVVGREQVLKGRDMHWIRVDRYFEGSIDLPSVHHQPVPCMHCENAPCEVVCPVEATVHDSEGLNEMIYNRCVGTRYCSNNCPYKVRRFNFLQYSDQETPSLKLLANPDVTVRTRGVMEKCTYCVQRISAGRIEAEKGDRRIRDGEVTPACAQACPATAIVFGDLNDAGSRVSQLKKSHLNYGILTELNTRPRTTYLADVRNLNPEVSALEGRLPGSGPGGHGPGEGHGS